MYCILFCLLLIIANLYRILFYLKHQNNLICKQRYLKLSEYPLNTEWKCVPLPSPSLSLSLFFTHPNGKIVHIVEIVARYSITILHITETKTYGTVNFEPFTIANLVFCFVRKYASFGLCFTFDAVKRLGTEEKIERERENNRHTHTHKHAHHVFGL